MRKPFRFLLISVVIYHILAIGLVYILHENGTDTVLQFYKNNANLLLFLNDNVLAAILTAVVGLFIAYRLEDRAPRFSAVYAFYASVLFFTTFSMVKTGMPLIFPYFADPTWAAIDKFIHFGVDPWKIVHIYIPSLGLPGIPAEVAARVYLTFWFLMSVLMPVIVALSDSDPLRKTRFVILFLVCWIGLGNILALLGLSVGPVFYDRVLDSDRFAEFTAFYSTSDLGNSLFKVVQEFLWEGYSTNSQEVGRGISAFPSVHVGMTTVFVLYFWERHWSLGVVMSFFWLFIFYYSIASGYHYALDGYASLLIIWGTWRFLLRQHRRSPNII